MSFRSSLARNESWPRVAIRFNNQDAFGNFCVALSEKSVPFNHLGSQSIVLSGLDFRQLPSRLSEIFDELDKRGFVEVYDPTPSVGRRTLTKEESDEALRKIARRWKALADKAR